ncbi:MAG: helix-turn-helix transcriptional regulator [Cyanobacteria bacterium P01_D01_bin.115]
MAEDHTSVSHAPTGEDQAGLLISLPEESKKALVSMADVSASAVDEFGAEAFGSLCATLAVLPERDRKTVVKLLEDWVATDQDEQRRMIRMELARFFTITDSQAGTTSDTPACQEFDHTSHAIHRQKVGDRLRRERDKRGLTQTSLSDLTAREGGTRITQSRISSLEQGKCPATYKTLLRLAKALGCKISQLDESYDD